MQMEHLTSRLWTYDSPNHRSGSTIPDSCINKDKKIRIIVRSILPCFTEDPDLCPMKNLQAYIDRTEDLRRESTDKPLFIALKKPHAGVTASNISRWLKEVMQRAAIDIEVFKLHSTHCASVSVAKQGECLCQTFSRLPSQHFRDSTRVGMEVTWRWHRRPVSHILGTLEFLQCCNSQDVAVM